MKNINKQKGITLVALVITIIILLILAGITINSLTGSGLFDKVKLAKEKSENAEKIENETLGEYESEIGKYIDGTRSNFQSTVWYPEGTDEQPETIGINQRIVIQNPYPGKKLHLVTQICFNEVWSDPGFVLEGMYGYGVKATQRQGNEIDEIIIQSGSIQLIAGSNLSGAGFSPEDYNGIDATRAPYRVIITCLD